jgi:hypothetical protein
MWIELNNPDLVVLFHLLDRPINELGYWESLFDAGAEPDNFASNKIDSPEKADQIFRMLKQKILNGIYDQFGNIKP